MKKNILREPLQREILKGNVVVLEKILNDTLRKADYELYPQDNTLKKDWIKIVLDKLEKEHKISFTIIEDKLSKDNYRIHFKGKNKNSFANVFDTIHSTFITFFEEGNEYSLFRVTIKKEDFGSEDVITNTLANNLVEAVNFVDNNVTDNDKELSDFADKNNLRFIKTYKNENCSNLLYSIKDFNLSDIEYILLPSGNCNYKLKINILEDNYDGYLYSLDFISNLILDEDNNSENIVTTKHFKKLIPNMIEVLGKLQ